MFIDEIKKICSNNKKVAMFVDMDGTIVEYRVFLDDKKLLEAHKSFFDEKPVMPIINILKNINDIENIDIYILSLSKSSKIKDEKKHWLEKYVPFIKEDKWIILDKEKGEYNSENRDFIKYEQMINKQDYYDYIILLDDDHKILKETKKRLKNNGEVFHVSSILA